jgi:hypothetical protein
VTPQETKVKENRMRRAARRRLGLQLVKANRRDRLAPDFGLFALIHPETGVAVNPPLANGFVCSWDLASVEAYLSAPSTLLGASK